MNAEQQESRIYSYESKYRDFRRDWIVESDLVNAEEQRRQEKINI